MKWSRLTKAIVALSVISTSIIPVTTTQVHATSYQSNDLKLAVSTNSIVKNDKVKLLITALNSQDEEIQIQIPEGVSVIEDNKKAAAEVVGFDQNSRSLTIKKGDRLDEKTPLGTVPIEVMFNQNGSYDFKATSKRQGMTYISDVQTITVVDKESKQKEQEQLKVQGKVKEVVLEKPKAEEVALEKPKAEEVVLEKPKAEEAVLEKPKTEEVALEEPTVVESEANEQQVQHASGQEVSVSNWNEFKDAYTNDTVSKINLTGDIVYTSGAILTYKLTRSLEIHGNGHTLDLKNQSIILGSPVNPQENVIHIHDATLSNTRDMAFVDVNTSWATSAKWKYRFGNIKTTPTVQRLATAARAEVTIYGNMDIDTRAENFYTGSIIIEPGTNYVGNVNYFNYSIFWYNVPAQAGDTGQSKEFTVGHDSKVRLSQSQTSGVTYPAVYSYYDDIIINENVVFNVAMPGNAVRFDQESSSFTAKKGSIVNLTSKQKSGAVVNYNNSNNYFKVESGAYFYTIGVSKEPLINLNRGKNNLFLLDSPAQYDIRNLDESSNSTAIDNGSNGEIRINNSDIDLWKMGTNVLGPSTLTYANVGYLSASSQSVKSSNADLQSNFSTKNFRRISGMNQTPTVEFTEEVTDANLTVKLRVKIGEVPDNNGADKNGDVNYIPVYASKDQAKVRIINDQNSEVKEISTDENGYVTYKVDAFYKAGTKLTATVERGPHKGKEHAEAIVRDVTPPNLAELQEKVTNGTKVIRGKNAEAGAHITYSINDKPTFIEDSVEEDGTWELQVPNTKLHIGDKLQFFLTDEYGNKNPIQDTKYLDAIFKAGTIIYVEGGYLNLLSAPNTLSFGDDLKVSSKDETYSLKQLDKKLTVSDERAERSPWTLTGKMIKVLENEKGYTLPDAVLYKHQGQSKILNENTINVYENTSGNEGTIDISENWLSNEEGLFLHVKAGEAKVGSYSGKIQWTLQDTPVNE
ncbi:pectate lyase-like adhesive domain-containing protein [Bacillus cereus]|uniref:pectate lyase-like adhesive domain-containing protein n=1 Tax=Bacillus cereus TaxID=1396 RepID=UPI001E304C67|nr:pectate lyase-like adhesive domain-containing protein [Bacillus cereus]MCC2454347.1 WxL domain-containing protein [Bacillus cereus]MCU5079051.1 WxL domain-containing protein [Bacillus cereus]